MSGNKKEFVRVCSVNDIAEGQAKAFHVGNKHIAVYFSEGKYYATDDICSHEHEHLSEGWLEGHVVECPKHGAQFDLKTGDAVSLPATEPIAVYTVKVENGDVLIEE